MLSYNALCNTWKRLGPFSYNSNYYGDYVLKDDTRPDGIKWIFYGHDGDGLGLEISSNGVLSEGYWESGKLHGDFRIIFKNGNHIIGTSRLVNGETRLKSKHYDVNGKVIDLNE